MLEEEELYWYKRAHEKWLHKGDNNTDYFHRIANGRKRKNTIISLLDGDQSIEGDDNLIKHATSYYKDLFCPAPGNTFPLDNNLWKEGEKVSSADNDFLCRPFSENEIKDALFSMERNKAAGPDNIPTEFFQSCWSIVKSDILDLFDEFHKGELDVSRLNYGVITLLPKVVDANVIQQFRPICLLNCLYKWITKTLVLRLDPLVNKLILRTQTTIMKNRNIISGVMALHGILH